MRKPSNPFAAPQTEPCFYDLIGDYDLIEASFAQQYGIRLRNEREMCWNEFCVLLSGLNELTPLGRTVAIRAETDMKIIEGMTPGQKRLRAAWRKNHAETVKVTDKEKYEKDMQLFKAAFAAMAVRG